MKDEKSDLDKFKKDMADDVRYIEDKVANLACEDAENKSPNVEKNTSDFKQMLK